MDVKKWTQFTALFMFLLAIIFAFDFILRFFITLSSAEPYRQAADAVMVAIYILLGTLLVLALRLKQRPWLHGLFLAVNVLAIVLLTFFAFIQITNLLTRDDEKKTEGPAVPSWQPIGTTAIVLLLLLAHFLFVYVIIIAWRTAKERRSYDFQHQENTQTTRY